MLTVWSQASPEEARDLRARYMRWLGDRLLRKRFKADPPVILSTSIALRSAAIDKLNNFPETTPVGAAYRLGLQQMFLEAPEGLRQEMLRDPELCPRIGLSVTWTIDIGAVTFPAPSSCSGGDQRLRSRRIRAKSRATIRAQEGAH